MYDTIKEVIVDLSLSIMEYKEQSRDTIKLEEQLKHYEDMLSK